MIKSTSKSQDQEVMLSLGTELLRMLEGCNHIDSSLAIFVVNKKF